MSGRPGLVATQAIAAAALICCLCLAALVLGMRAFAPIPQDAELRKVSGTIVQGVTRHCPGKGMPWAGLTLRTGQGMLEGRIESNDAIFDCARHAELLDLGPGDNATVWVVNSGLPVGGQAQVWKLSSQGRMLLELATAHSFRRRGEERMGRLFMAASVVGVLALLVRRFLLRAARQQ